MSYLDQFALPGVGEGRVQGGVLVQGVLGVQQIHAQVTQGRPEHVLLSAVLQEAVVQRRLGDLEDIDISF